MKEIFIEYNPYTITTHITVNGVELKGNSELANRCRQGVRLQEWIEDLPNLLGEENDKHFRFVFHGTKPDCNDLADVLKKAINEGAIVKPEGNFLQHIPTKSTSDREHEIVKLREKLRNCVLEEYLYTKEVRDAFIQQESNSFPICVVATMSAGKSTLINALIGERLMPAKAKSCTAIITRINNTSDKYKSSWTAEVRDKDGKLIQTFDSISLEDMRTLNADKAVYTVDVNGNIPFLSSKYVSLSFIDTPGPNNPHDPDHEATQKKYLEDNAKPMILVVIPQDYEKNDNHELLKKIADMMKVGGKQSKDRFMFAFNQMDVRNIDEDDTAANAVNDLKDHLEEKYGIVNPNVYPVSALTALCVHRVQNGECSERLILDTASLVEKSNYEGYDFEAYSSLTKSLRDQLKRQAEKKVELTDKMIEQINLNAQQINESKREKYINSYKEIVVSGNAALIHSGVPALEAAIKQYAEKYAKTAKISLITDVINKRINDERKILNIEDNLRHAINDKEKIAKDIENAKNEVSNAGKAKSFENNINVAVVGVKKDMTKRADEILTEYQGTVSQVALNVDKKYEVAAIDGLITALNALVNDLQNGFEEDLNHMIQNSLLKSADMLKKQYEGLLSNLSIGKAVLGDVSFTAIDLVSASIPSADQLVNKLSYTESVDDGKEWVKNTDKKWFKPWTWFQEAGYWRTKYKDVEYIDGSELFDQFMAPIKKQLIKNCNSAKDQANEQADKIPSAFKKEFSRINKNVETSLDRIRKFVENSEKNETRINELEFQKACLEDITECLDSIITL